MERATAYVEPRVNLFLRRADNTTRSARTLHPSFWRHTADNRPTSLWWPAYLQDIREISLAQSRVRPTATNVVELVRDDINAFLYVKPINSGQKKGDNVLLETRYGPGSLPSCKRSFSFSHGRRERPLAGLHDVTETKDDCLLYGMSGQDHTSDPVPNCVSHKSMSDGAPYSGDIKVPSFKTLPIAEKQLSAEESLRALLDSDEQDAYARAWQLFVHARAQARLAGDVLVYLSTSHHRADLEHAIRAYKLLLAVDRSQAHYQAAIKAACRRKQQKLAVEIHDEAFERGFHGETTDTLLAFLVRNGLWRTAARVWDRLPVVQRNAADPRNRDLWHQIDQYTALPEKLLQLIKRLEHNAAIYASDRGQIFGLGFQLLYRIFSSPEIMARITGPGTLLLLDRFYYLGLLKPHHYFSAIQTLNRMIGSRNRHQLATLLYRNLDMRFPKVRLPRSVLGSLLAILCESDNNHVASRVVLRRFATDWGKPDKQAYQKVLTACAQNGDSVNVNEVFAEFVSDYGKPTNMAFITPLLYVNARTGNVSETTKQFNRLHSDFALKPDAYCWNILITAHARARDHEGAFETFRNMKRAGIKPDQHTYGILMAICARSGDTEAVHQLVEAARQQDISGTTAMVDSLVHSYCMNDQVEDAENLVEAATQMRLKGSPTRMWNILLRHHAFRADTDSLLRTQERMKEVSVRADGMTYAALMQSLVNIGRTGDAASILRSLHLSNSTTATIFHYSIVLYGYALENNRDMVTVIYNEMVERFPRTSLSARFSRLRSHVHRDTVLSRSLMNQALHGKPMSQGLRLSNALDFLAQILLEVKQSELATKDPQPGLGRRAPSEVFPSVYVEFLIAAFGRSGALQKAENLLSRYQVLIDTSYRKYGGNSPSISMLTAIMITLVQQKRFAKVDLYWKKALSLAIDKGRQRTLKISDLLDEESMPQSSAARPEARGISLEMSVEASGNKILNPFLEGGDVKILAAHRYSVAAPLTQYMHSLSAQNLAANLPPLVRRLEEMGFSLSSKNWNHYLQILSYSNDADLQLLAFRIFEEKLLPNMPPWHLMKRSKWSKQMIVDGSGDVVIEEPVQRKFIERFRPHTLVPTYWTMIYLGLALMKAQQRGSRGEKPGIALLRRHAPGTVVAVSRMPYLRERAQGLLLRRRTLKGDPQKRPRRPPKVVRAGLRGSRSPLDHVQLDYPPHELESVLKRDRASSPQQVGAGQRVPLQAAQKISGEIQRSPLVLEAAGRYEYKPEYLGRLRTEAREKLQMLEQMRDDAEHTQPVANDGRGEPFFEAKLADQQASSATENITGFSNKKQEFLRAVVDHTTDSKQEIPRSPSAEGTLDIRPAALLSAARHPKAAERLHLIRRRRRRRPAIPLSQAAFRRNLRRKVTLALSAYQPPQRIPKRLQRAFTRNKAAREMRRRLRRARKARSEDTKVSDQDTISSDVGASEKVKSEYSGPR